MLQNELGSIVPLGSFSKRKNLMQSLEKIIEKSTASGLWPQIHPTRCHTLRQSARIWVKRDDELSFGISGSKLRKFAGLSSYWRENATASLVTLGGAHSNYLPACAQVLQEMGIPYRFLLPHPQPAKPQGNFALLHLASSPQNWQWVERDLWTELAQSEASLQSWVEQKVPGAKALAEGGASWPAFAGSLSLACELFKQRDAGQVQFDRIYVDAGRGLTAVALILGFAALDFFPKVEVVCMARSLKREFASLLQHWALELQKRLGYGRAMDLAALNYQLRSPVTAASFGATNSRVLHFIRDMARNEGILLDPVYTSKLFLTALSDSTSSTEDILILHSGGGWALSGYLDAWTP